MFKSFFFNAGNPTANCQDDDATHQTTVFKLIGCRNRNLSSCDSSDICHPDLRYLLGNIVLGKSSKNLLPNGGEIHGDESHGFSIRKNSPTKQTQEMFKFKKKKKQLIARVHFDGQKLKLPQVS